MRVEGVFPPIATPFGADGGLDEKGLRANIALWNGAGLAGYVVAGSNGESVLLSDDEVARAVKIVREAALGDQLVIAGTGRETTAGTIALNRLVADAGADLALVMTPSFYGGQMTSAVLVQHFSAVADASPIPVLIYNVPKFTHLNIRPEAVAELAAHPNIVGIKDSAGDIGQLINYLRACPPEFSVLVGNAPAFMSGVQAGASGGILALANVAPSQCVAIYESLKYKQTAQALELQFRMMPVGHAVTGGYGVPGLKAALDLLGYVGGDPRPPLLKVSDKQREEIREILFAAGLLG